MGDEYIIKKINEVQSQPIDRSKGASIQILLGAEEGMPNFYTRKFTLEPGCSIPLHSHADIEHQQVILEGEMVLDFNGTEKKVQKGDCIYIPAKLPHAYYNRSDKPVEFLCIIPATENYETEWLD